MQREVTIPSAVDIYIYILMKNVDMMNYVGLNNN